MTSVSAVKGWGENRRGVLLSLEVLGPEGASQTLEKPPTSTLHHQATVSPYTKPRQEAFPQPPILQLSVIRQLSKTQWIRISLESLLEQS